MTDKKPLRCEIAYATPRRQWVVAVELEEGATVADAVGASRLLIDCPELSHGELVLGVFGSVVAPERALQEGDRVEIYRPLPADPRSARRARAARKAR